MTENPGEDRCWPCTVANATVGLVVAWLPLAAALIEGAPAVVATCFTLYYLVQRGYLPFAETVARATGLHERIGPGSKSDPEEKR